MSSRVITDRELLHNLRFEVAELGRGLAAVVERLERVESALELDGARHSRRVGASFPLAPAPLEVVADVVACSCGRKVVES